MTRNIARLAATFGAVLALALLGTPANATSPTHVTSTASIVSTPDDGCPAWARDTFTRTTKITDAEPEVKAADVEAENHPHAYLVAITDDGTFVTKPGADSPGDAAVKIGTQVTGTLHGVGDFTVTGWLLHPDQLAALSGKTYDNAGYACKADVPAERTTGAWPLKFFKPGAKSSGIEHWTWTYATKCGDKASEQRTETTEGATGNITGKTCPSPSPSPSASASKKPASPTPPAVVSLPVTGPGSTGTLVAVGAGFLLVGAAVVWMLRRRRVAFSAE